MIPQFFFLKSAPRLPSFPPNVNLLYLLSVPSLSHSHHHHHHPHHPHHHHHHHRQQQYGSPIHSSYQPSSEMKMSMGMGISGMSNQGSPTHEDSQNRPFSSSYGSSGGLSSIHFAQSQPY
jgi:hypothetical protein